MFTMVITSGKVYTIAYNDIFLGTSRLREFHGASTSFVAKKLIISLMTHHTIHKTKLLKIELIKKRLTSSSITDNKVPFT